MKTISNQSIKDAFMIGVLTFLISAGWALVSPPGSSPDEDAHFTTIWCQSEYGSKSCAEVPLGVVELGKCYFLDADALPTCQEEIPNTGAKPERILNQNLFYLTLSKFIDTQNIEKSIILMRIFNALILALLVSSIVLISSQKVAYATVLGIMIVNIPLGYFIISSINSSAWPFIFTSILFPLFYNLMNWRSSILKSVIKIFVLIILFIICQRVRPDISLFVAIYFITLLPFIFIFEAEWAKNFRSTKFYNSLLLTISIILSFILVVFTWNRSNLVSFRDFEISAWETISRIPSIITGVFGGWGLGSLEVRMPSINYVLILFVFLALLFRGLKFSNISQTTSLLLQLMFAFLIPLFVIIQSNLKVGEWFQPRYILPIFYGITIHAIMINLNNLDRKIQLVPIAVISIISFAFALYTTARRYTIGLGNFDLNLKNDSSWWWDFQLLPNPITIIFISCLSYSMLWVYLYKRIKPTSMLFPQEFSKKTN
jgi:hypothetical protein